MQADTDFRAGFLSSDDTDAVFALHQRVAERTPSGHLALRSLDEIRFILSEEARSMSVGAWVKDRLIAYSLCNLETGCSDRTTPIMQLLAESGEPVWRGKGLAVDPEFRGYGAAGVLVEMQSKELRARHIVHTVALFATTNVVSLKGGIRSGVWIVGIERDAYCDNFVGYGGSLQQRFDIAERMDLPANDLAGLRQALHDGWVGLEVNVDETDAMTTISFGRPVPATSA